jgi:hypothetical protein
MKYGGSMRPKTLRGALNQIQEMLSGKDYSMDLWNVLVALRGPDSRNRKIKYATTALIRSAAFPKRPCEDLSVFGEDAPHLVQRRLGIQDLNHFREHVKDAFDSLGLNWGKINGKHHRSHLRRERQGRRRG